MRPNAVGWVIVAIFGGLGIVFAVFVHDPNGDSVWLGLIFVAVSLFLAALYTWMIVKSRDRGQLMQTGLHGRAKVKQWTDTGTTVNEQPLVKLVLEMHVDGLPVYEIEKRTIVPRTAVGALTAGELSVYVDPADKEKFAIDWSGGGPA
jgi:hypothetical protein